MADKVWITMRGVRIMDGEKEKVDEKGEGDYFRKNGKHYIIWRHDKAMVKRIRLTEDSMTVAESGGQNAMEFEKGRRTRMLYKTSEGRLQMEIQTRRFCLQQEEDLLEANVEYSLYHNGVHLSDSRIKLTACPLKADGQK